MRQARDHQGGASRAPPSDLKQVYRYEQPALRNYIPIFVFLTVILEMRDVTTAPAELNMTN